MNTQQFKNELQVEAKNIRESLFGDSGLGKHMVKLSYTKRQQQEGEFTVYTRDEKSKGVGQDILDTFKNYGGLVLITKGVSYPGDAKYTFRIQQKLEYVEAPTPTPTSTGGSRTKKMSDEDYVKAAEEFLSGKYTTKKAVADAYGVNSAVISDMFNEKYVRKSCAESIKELRTKYNK